MFLCYQSFIELRGDFPKFRCWFPPTSRVAIIKIECWCFQPIFPKSPVEFQAPRPIHFPSINSFRISSSKFHNNLSTIMQPTCVSINNSIKKFHRNLTSKEKRLKKNINSHDSSNIHEKPITKSNVDTMVEVYMTHMICLHVASDVSKCYTWYV